MFPYDAELLDIMRTPAPSITLLIDGLHQIDALTEDGDGLKWFNHLYLEVTEAVQARVDAGQFESPDWLRQLDVEFGAVYYSAVSLVLQGSPCPRCWQAILAVRDNARLARIQFALAGINSHINHDLPQALVATARATGRTPADGTAEQRDYTLLNPVIEGLIQKAKADLHVRLLGDPLPGVSHLEDLLAAWGLSSARGQAWKHGEALWTVRDFPIAADAIENGLDGLTTFGNKALLIPVS